MNKVYFNPYQITIFDENGNDRYDEGESIQVPAWEGNGTYGVGPEHRSIQWLKEILGQPNFSSCSLSKAAIYLRAIFNAENLILNGFSAEEDLDAAKAAAQAIGGATLKAYETKVAQLYKTILSMTQSMAHEGLVDGTVKYVLGFLEVVDQVGNRIDKRLSFEARQEILKQAFASDAGLTLLQGEYLASVGRVEEIRTCLDKLHKTAMELYLGYHIEGNFLREQIDSINEDRLFDFGYSMQSAYECDPIQYPGCANFSKIKSEYYQNKGR